MQELQRLQKEQMEQLHRRTSCRLLARKLYEEEEGVRNSNFCNAALNEMIDTNKLVVSVRSH